MSVVVLTSDLATGSQIHVAAKHVGVPCATALGPKSLMEKAPGSKLVLIDLTTPQLNLAEIIASLKGLESPPAVVAFGPHVHVQTLQAAKEAGCDAVLTRGQMHSQAAELMERYAK